MTDFICCLIDYAYETGIDVYSYEKLFKEVSR